MTSVHFRAGGLDLELHGSESFVLRQLHSFSPCLGSVDMEALASRPAAETPPRAPEAPPIPPALPSAPAAADHPAEPGDEFLEFCRAHPVRGKDQQAEAALLFAYWLHRHEGMSTLRLGDLLRCCIRAGVDTRNFNRAIGGLLRRSLLLPSQNGSSYRLSEQGVAFVESKA